MKKSVKLLLAAAALVLVVGVAYVAYDYLSLQQPGGINLVDPPPDPGTAGQSADSSASPSEEAAPPEPEYIMTIDFTVYDRDSQAVKLSDYYGKPVVLNFWASWCPPCKAEMPEFDQVWKELGEDVHFLMVNATDGSRETLDTSIKYVDEAGYSFPVFYDVTMEASYIYGISSLPTTLFIDRNGFYVTGATGSIDKATLRKGIEYAIDQGPLTDGLSTEE